MPRPVVHQRLIERIQPAFLRSSVAIQSPTEVPDGQGGWTRTYATTSTVMGRLYPWEPGESGDEQFSADKTTLIISHRAILPKGTEVDGEDQLVVNGQIYRVVWVAERESHTAVTLLEIS